ncbi:MAG TPA: cupredoxin family copper-binding protein [Chthoniobacterales bacterium]|nr:cupredoxin family copper-binding protein [Chthoniobacterales bacterium]
MRYPTPPRASQEIDYHESADVPHVRAAIEREKREPRAGLEPLSLWLIGCYAVAIFVGGFYFGRYSGSFSGDSLDPAGAPEVTRKSTVAGTAGEQLALSPPVPADTDLAGGKTRIAPQPGAARVVQIAIRNMKFDPPRMEVHLGDTVEWKNDDITPHTATSAGFDSGSIDPDKSWRQTFTKAGQFAYACTFHPEMKGALVVKEP